MPTTLLRQATIVHADVTSDDHGAGPADVLIVDGVIAAVGTVPAERPADEVVDLSGQLLLPAAVEPHAHLDKAYLAERVENRTGDLLGAIDAMIALAPTITFDDIVERAERAARRMAATGYVAVRTQADRDTEFPPLSGQAREKREH